MNEKTSKRVAAIAGKILRGLTDKHPAQIWIGRRHSILVQVCTIAEIKALCASALTQAVDRSKKKRATK